MTTTRPAVIIVRRVKAPPARVFAAITTPELMLQWWGVDAGLTLGVEADLRPGGRFSLVFRTLDGRTHNPTGAYHEVVPDRKLVFTWEWPGMDEWDSLVTFDLKPIDIGTELTLTHAQLPDAALEGHHAGWSGLLEKLSTFLGDAR